MPRPVIEDEALHRPAVVRAATHVQSRHHPVVVVDVLVHARLPHLQGVDPLPEEEEVTRDLPHPHPVDVGGMIRLPLPPAEATTIPGLHLHPH